MSRHIPLPKPWVIATTGSALIAALVLVGFGFARAKTASFPTQLTNRMGLVSMGGAQAPNFTLVDQHGQTTSLSDFRGHPVVLEFFDSVCQNECPLISADFLNAAKRLGPRAQDVHFVAVNVNADHAAVSDVAAFTKQHSLDTLPHWSFLTGETSTLAKVWNAYGISVYKGPDGDVKHQDWMFFIGRNGNEQWIASPDATISDTAQWGSDIATVVKTLF